MKMNYLTALIATAAMSLFLTACNESFHEDAKDVNASQRAIAKDNAAIRSHSQELAEDRAEKAAAKARGDRVTQAGKSLEIGADKAIIDMKQTERKVDERILEEDKEDLTKH